MCNEATYSNSIEIAKCMIMRKKVSLEEIAENTGLALDKIQELIVTKETQKSVR